MADAVDSKSTGNNLVGSTPTAGTNFFSQKMNSLRRVAPAGMWSAVGLAPSRASSCAKPILRAKNVGLVGLVGLVGRLAQGYVGAMRSGNSKAQGAAVGQNIPVQL